VVAFGGGRSVCELLLLGGGYGAAVLCAEQNWWASSVAWSNERGLFNDAGGSVRMVGRFLNEL
jgi:hypothetical protein